MPYLKMIRQAALGAAVCAALLQAPLFPAAVRAAEPPLQQEITDTADTTAAAAEETPAVIDHSAEYKPVVNEFLKEGEGRPASETVPKTVPKYTGEDRKAENELLKLNKNYAKEKTAARKARAAAEKERAEIREKKQASRATYSLTLDTDKYQQQTLQVNGSAVTFRAYEGLPYAARPYAPEYQKLNLYVPDAYFHGGSVNGYTAETAPIFMPNNVGGYMPGDAATPSETSRHGGANAVLRALSRGCVVAAPAIRGRTLQDANGYYVGKAPALIVDYKAAVRYVRLLRDKGLLPAGDTDRIVASGTSAGGALATLLGATGNSRDYQGYLKDIGAAKERDDIFAVQAYCPITNLDNADMAYEWMFNGIPMADKKPVRELPSGASSDGKIQLPPEAGGVAKPLTEQQRKASAKLKESFATYLNDLNLKDGKGNILNVATDGSGLFKEYIEGKYIEAAQAALDNGTRLGNPDWLTVSGGKVVFMDTVKYANAVKRLKSVPAFDSFDLSSGENSEFGDAETDRRHFTWYSLVESGELNLPDPDMEKAEDEKAALAWRLAEGKPQERLALRKAQIEKEKKQEALPTFQHVATPQVIKMMNPMYYIGTPDAGTAPYWRIRHGVLDRDTALAVPAILALKLENEGARVDFQAVWGYGHDGDYDLDRLFDWIDASIQDQENKKDVPVASQKRI